MFRIRSNVIPGFRNLSDHVPVHVNMSIKHQTQGSSNKIPSHVVTNPVFKSRTEELFHQLRLDNPHWTCWDQLKCLKSTMHEVSNHIRKYCKTSAQQIEGQFSIAARFFRCVMSDDLIGLNRCIEMNKDLANCFHVVNGKTSLTNSFYTMWTELVTKSSVGGDGPQDTSNSFDSKGSVAKIVSGFQPASCNELDALWDTITNKPVFDSCSI